MGSFSLLSKTKQYGEKISAEQGFEHGAAGWEARMLPLRYAAPLNNIFFKMRANIIRGSHFPHQVLLSKALRFDKNLF